MAAIPFRLNIDDQPQYFRWENQIDSYIFASDDILTGVRQFEAKIKPEAERLRAGIHQPTTKSLALNVEIISLIALKVLVLAGGWIASNAVFSALKPPIFSLISRISYASPISWVIAFIVSTLAFNIMTGIADWVLEPFRKKVMEMDGFKFMQEVYKARGCLAALNSQISKVKEEEKIFQAVELKEGGMTADQKELLLRLLSEKR